MNPIDYIVSYCNTISSWFYSIYLEVIGWVYPFWYAAAFFYQLSLRFNDLAWSFYYFSQWVNDVAAKVASILSYSNIYSYFKTYFDYATSAWMWILNAWTNVTSIINSWWSSTQYTVQSWIDAARSFLQTQINTLNSLLATLQSQVSTLLAQIPSINEIISWFSNWWGNVIATIITWGALTALQIQSLLDSAFIAYAPFWEGWQDWKDSVIEFIQDPWQWLYDRAEDLFDRFW